MRDSQNRLKENLITHARSLAFPSAASRKNDPDGLSVLVSEVAPEHCCLVFCSTKKNCESVAKLISSNLSPELQQWRTAEKLKLRRALEVVIYCYSKKINYGHLTLFQFQQESGRLCPILRSTLPFGIAYHHSGLTADERQLIEEAFSSGTLCCLCCTSTLAAGVNLPARRVYFPVYLLYCATLNGVLFTLGCATVAFHRK